MSARTTRITADFFDDDVESVARLLIGADLYTNVAGSRVGGKIIATECYGPGDPFSHSYDGPGAELKPGATQMSGPPGRIYFAENGQGCTFNISCGPEGHSSAVLICALRPFCNSTAIMRARRKRPVGYTRDLKSYDQDLDNDQRYISILCDGPLKLCDALGITTELYELSHAGELSIEDKPFELFASGEICQIDSMPREGLNKMLKRFKPERAAHPDVERYRSTLSRFSLKGLGELPPCLPD